MFPHAVFGEKDIVVQSGQHHVEVKTIEKRSAKVSTDRDQSLQNQATQLSDLLQTRLKKIWRINQDGDCSFKKETCSVNQEAFAAGRVKQAMPS